MTTTKLAINLSEGTVQVEGNEDFVRFVYEDFKTQLSKNVWIRPTTTRPLEHAAKETHLITDESRASKKSSPKPANDERSRAKEYKPSFNTKLDLTGLDDLYDAWNPENNFEKILLFAVFLRDSLNIAPCSVDDIYTCFATLSRKGKTKVPEAFSQAFRDAQHRTHYIERRAHQIHITIPGDNRYNEKKNPKKKETK